MQKLFFLLGMIITPVFIFAQVQQPYPGWLQPKITEKGQGIVDTRIDHMGYWRRMVKEGMVEADPFIRIPAAIYTGSGIEGSRTVTTTDSPDVPVTSSESTQSENSVFVDPTDEFIVLNSNNSTDNPVTGVYGANYFLSDDGTDTWDGSIYGAGGGNSGDPTTAISLSGRMYVGFINSASGQSVSYSADGGATWTAVVCGTSSGDLLDKNHMWIDNSPVSPYEGNVYSSWTDFGLTNYPVRITRSADDGLTYSTPVSISAGVSAGSHNQGVNIGTGPNGEVYVIWAIYDSWPSDETAIGFTKSTNGGASYTTATRIISNIKGIRNTTAGKNHRVNSFPSMAVDISGGPNNGNIYIVWANVGVPGTNTGTDVDVYMIRSTNGGTSWSTPIRVNQDPIGQGKKHYFPWITCDPVSGVLSVIFYDDRNVSSTQCEVYCANSTDAGNTWENLKVSDVAFTPAPIPGLASSYMGDYLGISARNGMVYPVWPDNRSGSVMTYSSAYILNPVPAARFLANDINPCLNETVSLTDQSRKDPTTWNWTITPATFAFVNGTNAASQNPQVQFQAYGDYTVRLIASNTYGADTLIKSTYISVSATNADFSANNTTPVINTQVVFTDLSSCDITSYSWNFGADATPATAATAGPHNVTYSSTGFKTVSLTLNGSVTETKTDYIHVLPETFNMSNTTITTCSGTFYDPQGAGSYTDNQDFTMTFYPADTSKSVRVTFSEFDLEYNASCGWDYLKIYDGPSISVSLLGTWCGTTSPGTVTSSHASGALTFVFHADGSVTGTGWTAALSCVETPPPPPPSYCAAGSSTTNCDEYIARVQIGSIDNSTACSSPGGYGNYTSLSTKVSPTFGYAITVTNGKTIYPSDQCGIWVDWNYDGDFTDAGETITVSGTPGVGPYTATITVPANAHKGNARMRIRIMYTGTLSSCGTTTYGEVEDYNLYVGTPGLWNGGTAGSPTDWNTANNWDDGRVPTASTNVVIPEGVTFYPVAAGNYACNDMTIQDNSTMTIQPGANITVNGDLDIGESGSGDLIINASTCTVSGVITVSPGSSVSISNGGQLIEN